MFRKLREAGASEEVRELLKKVWGNTVKVGRAIYYVGKVIVYEFLKLLKKHPGLAAGLAAASGVTLMAAKIPVIGTYIWPYVAVISFGLFGSIGLKLGSETQGRSTIKHLTKVLKDFIASLRNMIRTIWPEGAEDGLIPVLAS